MGTPEETALTFEDRDGWRAWLERHHDSTDEAWLVYFKKHTGKASVRQTEAVEEALCFGWIDTKVRRLDEELRKHHLQGVELCWKH